MDTHQEQFRTIVLPPDPVPIQNPRPENYQVANNPNSPIGQTPGLQGSNIGTLTENGGTASAFDGNIRKTFAASAGLSVSGSSFTNWVGKNWQADAPLPITGMSTVPQTYLALSFVAYAPRDARFLASGATNYAFQQSADATTWTTLASGITTGAIGETVMGNTLTGSIPSRFHRFVLGGNGSAVSVAQLSINTDRGSGVTNF